MCLPTCWYLFVAGKQLVCGWRNVGQQVQFRGVLLRRMPGRMRGTVPLHCYRHTQVLAHNVLVSVITCSLLLPPFLFVRVFGHDGSSGEEIGYVNWLNMARAGLTSLEFYSPETGHWRQVGSWCVCVCVCVCVTTECCCSLCAPTGSHAS